MKKYIALVLLFCVVSGCNGVWMNAEYSDILDRTVALSSEVAARPDLTLDEAKGALDAQAATWKLFKDARDGVK